MHCKWRHRTNTYCTPYLPLVIPQWGQQALSPLLAAISHHKVSTHTLTFTYSLTHTFNFIHSLTNSLTHPNVEIRRCSTIQTHAYTGWHRVYIVSVRASPSWLLAASVTYLCLNSNKSSQGFPFMEGS